MNLWGHPYSSQIWPHVWNVGDRALSGGGPPSHFTGFGDNLQPAAHEVGGDQRAIGRIPQQDGICLCQSDQRSHRCGARGDRVLLVVSGDDHELESAIIPIWPSDPIGVENLQSSRLLARAGMTFSKPGYRSMREELASVGAGAAEELQVLPNARSY